MERRATTTAPVYGSPPSPPADIIPVLDLLVAQHNASRASAAPHEQVINAFHRAMAGSLEAAICDDDDDDDEWDDDEWDDDQPRRGSRKRRQARRSEDDELDDLLMPLSRLQACGPTTSETTQWLSYVRSSLSPNALVALRKYAAACATWHHNLINVVTTAAADPDWDMTSAPTVWPNEAEQRLAAALEAADVPVEAQVGVSRGGGATARRVVYQLLA